MYLYLGNVRISQKLENDTTRGRRRVGRQLDFSECTACVMVFPWNTYMSHVTAEQVGTGTGRTRETLPVFCSLPPDILGKGFVSSYFFSFCPSKSESPHI